MQKKKTGTIPGRSPMTIGCSSGSSKKRRQYLSPQWIQSATSVGAWAITRRSVPVEQGKMVERREVASRERVVVSRTVVVNRASLTAVAVASLAAKDHSRERGHLDTREKEMGQLKDVGPVADRISHINARRAIVEMDSRKAGYDHYVGCKQ